MAATLAMAQAGGEAGDAARQTPRFVRFDEADDATLVRLVLTHGLLQHGQIMWNKLAWPHAELPGRKLPAVQKRWCLLKSSGRLDTLIAEERRRVSSAVVAYPLCTPASVS